MAILSYQKQRNLENSWADFVQDAIDTQNLTITDPDTGKPLQVNVTVGFPKSEDWNLPVISGYTDGKLSPRLSIGSNCRLDSFLMIIDVRAPGIGTQLDLTEFIQNTINDGWTFFEYSPNPSDPQNPIKVEKGHVSIDFLSNVPVRLGENVDLFDKYRQNISLSCTIQITS